MFSEAALLAWSALSLVWWLVAWRMVRGATRERVVVEKPAGGRSLTIFKPLALLGPGPMCESAGLQSFIAQLDESSEMLLGVHEADRMRVEPFLEAMSARYPQARVKTIWRTEPDTVANPKVAWLKILAPHASGDLWLWSDADIVAPPDFLRTARADYAEPGARMMTWPYVVRELARGPALLDALFVNAEFFPGVLLLRGSGPVDFGLGAAMLFSRDDFEGHVGWEEIGAVLADDFLLGQKLQPVRLGGPILTTVAEEESWRGAVRHYLRWSKTIRWNRPWGTAARIFVLPVLGWIAYVAFRPESLFGWAGLLGTTQMDVIFAWLICGRVGCRLGWRDVPAMEAWSVGRAWAWLWCWLPGPVYWRGQVWSGGRVEKAAK
jgi:hypothetical protein